MRPARPTSLLLVLIGLVLAGCGQSASSAPSVGVRANGAASPARWASAKHVRGVVDLTAPSGEGTVVVAAHGRLLTLSRGGAVRPYAPRYSAPPGLEPYIVRSSGQRVPAAGCRFAPGAVYALRLRHGNGVTIVDSRQRVRRFAALPARGLENGITFDLTGRFGHRLLVTVVKGSSSTLYAIDCRGRVKALTRSGARVEGGLAVAPAGFGRFGGDLIAPDEISGRIYAISPSGRFTVLADSGIAFGQDIGVESGGFVPPSFSEALVADRRTRANAHPGDDAILGLSRAALSQAGVSAGDLLVVSEGGAATVDVRCGASCQVRPVADGPAIAHIEGHVAFR